MRKGLNLLAAGLIALPLATGMLLSGCAGTKEEVSGSKREERTEQEETKTGKTESNETEPGKAESDETKPKETESEEAATEGQDGKRENDRQEHEAQENSEETALTFTDDLGREVTVPAKPERVASLLGSFTDIWCLAGGEVVATPDDAWEDFGLSLPEDTVNLGNTKDLSLELLFSAEPDFVLASANTRVDLDWLDTLEDAGIPVAYFDVANFEAYLRMLKICTDITGRVDLYEENGLAVETEIAQILEESQAHREESGTPSVLSLRASASSVRAKNSKGNVLGELLAELGCENIADSEESLLENLSIEHILQCDPDYILIVQQGDDAEGMKRNVEQFIADNPAWSSLTAVKEDRVYYVEKRLYGLKPNARWAEAYQKLADIFWPEADYSKQQ